MKYPVAVREGALRLLQVGLPAREVAARFRMSHNTIVAWARAAGFEVRRGVIGGLDSVPVDNRLVIPPGQDWVEANGRLTEAARVLIEVRKAANITNAQIAVELGVHRATVGRELRRNTVGGTYRARTAHTSTVRRRTQPKPRTLIRGTPLWDEVVDRLNQKFSPEQISHDLARVFPDRDDMRVSHETIYQALYVQGKGALRQELTVAKALRSGRSRRRPQSKLPSRSRRSWIGDGSRITDRPAEVEDRAVPGQWEGDLVIGAGQQSALITLVERTTRYTMIRRLPLTHDAPTVEAHLVQMMTDLPAELRQTLTWDQGSEMATHVAFTLATDCKVFFCDPHSPWQRGTNENTNGLIRDFYPKGTNFRQVTDADIAETQRLLNIRPRRTLDWHPPADKLNELLTVAPTS